MGYIFAQMNLLVSQDTPQARLVWPADIKLCFAQTCFEQLLQTSYIQDLPTFWLTQVQPGQSVTPLYETWLMWLWRVKMRKLCWSVGGCLCCTCAAAILLICWCLLTNLEFAQDLSKLLHCKNADMDLLLYGFVRVCWLTEELKVLRLNALVPMCPWQYLRDIEF